MSQQPGESGVGPRPDAPSAVPPAESPERHLRAVGEPASSPAPTKKRKKRSLKATAETREFFQLPKQHPIVKARIVASYFSPWARIVRPRARSGKIAYIDLYAGPGKYDDGTDSTPILIFRAILQEDSLKKSVVTILADADSECVKALQANVAALPGIGDLKFPPQIGVGEADDHGIAERYANQSVIPTYMYLDPFGYAGLSVGLIRAIAKDWGCEVVFFFSYRRILAAITNDKVRPKMDAIFGGEGVDKLRALLPTLREQHQKETAILSALETSLNGIGIKYVLPFRFRGENGQVTHHLVFVTKNNLAHDIMKRIMFKESSSFNQGVASFEFQTNPPMIQAGTPLDDLKADLLEKFRGRTILMEDLYQEHNYKTPYVLSNYQDALEQLWREDKISAYRDPDAHKPALNQKSKAKLPQEYTFVVFDKV